MSIQVGDNFNYLGKKPLDNRTKYSTIAEMASMNVNTLYDGIIAYCMEDGKNYQWKSANTEDATLGKWREFSTGSVDPDDYYTKSETNTLLAEKQDIIQVSTMPTLSEDINEKIYQYVGSDETTYKTGHFYKVIYIRRISYYWGSSGIHCWTLKLPTNGLVVGDPVYQDADCTIPYGTVTAIKGDTWIMAQGYDTAYTGTTHTIEEDIRWEEVTTGSVDFDDLNNRPLESEAIDLSELDLPLPAKPTEYPIGFDETGQEYQVSWYRRDDGKVKPIYRKNVHISNTEFDVSDTNPYDITNNIPLNVEQITNAYSINTVSNTPACAPLCAWNRTAESTPAIRIMSARTGGAYVTDCIFEYTKTTDEWKEV